MERPQFRYTLGDSSLVGIFCVEKQNYNTGLAILEQATEICGFEQAPAEWYFAQGVCHIVLKNYERAIQCFWLCIEANYYPQLAQYYIAVAELLLKHKDEGYNILLNLLTKYPRFSSGWFLLGQVYEELYRSYNSALTCYKNYETLRPNSRLAAERIKNYRQKSIHAKHCNCTHLRPEFPTRPHPRDADFFIIDFS